MTKHIKMDLLLLYIREDGVFARYLSMDGETRIERSVRGEITEETLTEEISALVRAVSDECGLLSRRVTVAFALARRVEVLRSCVLELLRGFRFSDSVSEISRDELLFRTATSLSTEDGVGLLYCDTRETRLFTAVGEIPLSSGRTGGNGFYDWLLGFVYGEEDSFEHYKEQEERLRTLFRAYRCFPLRGREHVRGERIFPDRAAYPLLYGKRTKETESSASVGERIDYATLSSFEKIRVDRKYPALYRKTRDARGRYKHISMGEAAERFTELFCGLSDAGLSRIVLIGHYAEFPLTVDYLSSLAIEVSPAVLTEERLFLDGLEESVVDRISGARLVLRDIDGEAVTLWEAPSDEAEVCPQKRIALRTTLRRFVSEAEWKKGVPRMPYTIDLIELRRGSDGSYKRVRVTKRGDFREFCYKRDPGKGYRLRTSETEGGDTAFRAVLLGISATPIGVYCRVLSEEKGELVP